VGVAADGAAAGCAAGVFCTAYDQFLSFAVSWGILLWKGERGWKDSADPPAENVNSDDEGTKEVTCEPSEVLVAGVVDLGGLPDIAIVVLYP